jgi:hypothetical protein
MKSDLLKGSRAKLVLKFGLIMMLSVFSASISLACVKVKSEQNFATIEYSFLTADLGLVHTTVKMPDFSKECLPAKAAKRQYDLSKDPLQIIVTIANKSQTFIYSEMDLKVDSKGYLESFTFGKPAANYSINYLPTEIDINGQRADVVIVAGSKGLWFKLGKSTLRN